MGMICIISGNQLPASFWRNHLKQDEIKQVSQAEFKQLDLSKTNPEAVIIDDYFNPVRTSRKKVQSIASLFGTAPIFHLSPENVLGIKTDSRVKFHSFSPQFLCEINDLKK
ncbi:MAG: hypothetical protein ACJAU0_002544 [Flavobacteriales bacterium]|jgi:hypothetical protein